MRKKIGKRIGPVPITLVAVFALAAFISAGLLLTLGGAQAHVDATRTRSLPSRSMSARPMEIAATAPLCGTCRQRIPPPSVISRSHACLMLVPPDGDTDPDDPNRSIIYRRHIDNVADQAPEDLLLFEADATGGGEFASMQAARNDDDGDTRATT